MKRKFLLLFLLTFTAVAALQAQQALTLDSCLALALRGNKAIAIGRAKVEKAGFDRKTAHTNYLPKIGLTATYMRTGNELSLLSDGQKQALTSLGTTATQQATAIMQQIVATNPELAPLVQQIAGQMGAIGAAGNGIGQNIVDALRTDTRNLSMGAVLLTQPLYTGGKIRAYDRLTRQAALLAEEGLRAETHEVRLNVETAYWQVVALANKKRLAESYRNLLAQLHDDVAKMIGEGVATKAAGLSVSVKLNEAEMTLTKVDNGLTLSRMLLCRLCSLPVDEKITLADETADDLALAAEPAASAAGVSLQTALANRPEMRQLAAAEAIYAEKVKIERSAFLPQAALTAGYALTNPSVFNGFENKFKGTWAVGVMLKMPLWRWGESRHKVNAARAEAKVAGLQREEAGEKIELQLQQSAFRTGEAEKQLSLAMKNLDKAEENLRTAQIGHAEGVIATSDLLAAQTAWLQAHSEKINAQIETRLARAALRKAQGLH